MRNATMYCLCIHNKVLPVMKKLGYVPVGLGKEKFSNEWLTDNTLDNISHKNEYYKEWTFHYWFWKNILPTIEDNHWIGFCAYRDFWSRKKNIRNDSNFKFNKEGVPNLIKTNTTQLEELVLREIPKEWENFETVTGAHHYLNNLKLSKLVKHGMWSLARNPMAVFKSKRSLRFHFDMWHGNGNLDKAINLLDEKDRENFKKYTRENISISRANVFFCRSKKIMNNYYNSLFPWLERCEKIFGSNSEGYNSDRIYAFLSERYQSYWFERYTKTLFWPVFFYDILK